MSSDASRDGEHQLLTPVYAPPCSYPGKIREHHHRTLAYLPTDVALALSDSPKLIAEAVGAFYEREPGMLKVRRPITLPVKKANCQLVPPGRQHHEPLFACRLYRAR